MEICLSLLLFFKNTLHYTISHETTTTTIPPI